MKKITFLLCFLAFTFSYAQTTCPVGEIADCNGNCAPESWVGDSYCDDGTYSYGGNDIYFNCAEFECDGGDCVCDGDCPYPQVTSWSMTGDGASFDGNNQESVIGYQIEYSTSPFTGGDGNATVYEFDSFPHDMVGVLEPGVTYYMTIQSVCADGVSGWADDGMDGPDQWTTSTCASSYSLPYLNDFGGFDPATGNPTNDAITTWSNCNTFYSLDDDTDAPNPYNFWFLLPIDSEQGNTAVSYSIPDYDLDPDNWFVLGPIDLTNEPDAMLTWDMVNGGAPDFYSVYVGTSSGSVDLIESSLVSYEETTTNADATQWNARELDISAAVGNEVYVAFRHHNSAGQVAIGIDNVSITSTLSNEEFSIENLNYSYNIDSKELTIDASEMLTKVNIYNLLGQEVISNDVNGYNVNMNLSELNGSVYIVTVEGVNNASDSFKIIVK
tara:strand:+ start:1102 stop:2424 length:1323 start_codon:yes stop_codon:yes gene_type:complete